jgi:hypothetical protein
VCNQLESSSALTFTFAVAVAGNHQLQEGYLRNLTVSTNDHHENDTTNTLTDTLAASSLADQQHFRTFSHVRVGQTEPCGPAFHLNSCSRFIAAATVLLFLHKTKHFSHNQLLAQVNAFKQTCKLQRFRVPSEDTGIRPLLAAEPSGASEDSSVLKRLFLNTQKVHTRIPRLFGRKKCVRPKRKRQKK